jgi:hypothetical protein
MRVPQVKSCLLPLLLVLATSTFATDPEVAVVERVSIIGLIATPNTYQGRTVLVTGYLTIGFEDNVLYLNRDDAVNGNSKNGVWIGYGKPVESPDQLKEYDAYYARLRPFNKGYVTLEGIFDGKATGHLDCCSGELTSITRIVSARPTR